MTREDLKQAIFGSFDGLTSALHATICSNDPVAADASHKLQ